MKMPMKWLLMGLLALPGLAFAAGGEVNPSDPMMDDQAQSDVELGEEIRTGMEVPGQQEIFANKKESFEIKGTVGSVDAAQNKITLQREDLPPAELSVAQQTEIKLEDKAVQLGQLEPGTEVRARFQLAEGDAVAVELNAKHSKAQKEMMKQEQKAPEPMPEP